MRAALALLPLLVACSDGDSDDSSDTDPPDADAALAELIPLLEDVETWGRSANWPGIDESLDGGHEASHAEIWWNASALNTLNGGGGGDMPIGAISAKLNYADAEGAEPTYFFAMHKTADDWFFAMFNEDRTETIRYGYEPDMSNCHGCHEAGQDFVLAETW